MQTETSCSKEVCSQALWVSSLGGCRVGIRMSAVEVRFENLSVDADVHVGGRALPTVLNSLLNVVEVSVLSIHRRCHLEDQDSGLDDSCCIL